MPNRPRSSRRIAPPYRAFALIVLSCLAQVYALTWIDLYFRSLGVEVARLDFWISRYLATLAAIVDSPDGIAIAAIVVFGGCRACGWVIRKLAVKSGELQFVALCVEPLVVLANLLLALIAIVGVVQPIVTVCRASA